MHTIGKLAYAAMSLALVLILAGCGGGGDGTSTADRCADLASTSLPVAKAVIKTAVLNAATSSLPEHCQIDGAINERTGADGQQYAIKFRLRLPTDWNGRFYMGGGGGTNGTLVDPTSVLAMRYATIGTDSGHDNSIDNNPNAGGTASFGVDPQARIDFAYNSYDQVTQIVNVLGSRRDRHELIGEGAIGEPAFRHIMNDPRLARVAKVIETPKLDDATATDGRMLKLLRGFAR